MRPKQNIVGDLGIIFVKDLPDRIILTKPIKNSDTFALTYSYMTP